MNQIKIWEAKLDRHVSLSPGVDAGSGKSRHKSRFSCRHGMNRIKIWKAKLDYCRARRFYVVLCTRRVRVSLSILTVNTTRAGAGKSIAVGSIFRRSWGSTFRVRTTMAGAHATKRLLQIMQTQKYIIFGKTAFLQAKI
jgi:hypothetical protein